VASGMGKLGGGVVAGMTSLSTNSEREVFAVGRADGFTSRDGSFVAGGQVRASPGASACSLADLLRAGVSAGADSFSATAAGLAVFSLSGAGSGAAALPGVPAQPMQTFGTAGAVAGVFSATVPSSAGAGNAAGSNTIGNGSGGAATAPSPDASAGLRSSPAAGSAVSGAARFEVFCFASPNACAKEPGFAGEMGAAGCAAFTASGGATGITTVIDR
jgi:hypothetical protein